MNKEMLSNLIDKYLKGTINQEEKDLLLDESLKALNQVILFQKEIRIRGKYD